MLLMSVKSEVDCIEKSSATRLGFRGSRGGGQANGHLRFFQSSQLSILYRLLFSQSNIKEVLKMATIGCGASFRVVEYSRKYPKGQPPGGVKIRGTLSENLTKTHYFQ
jgi:hypothetical protein